MNRRTYLVGIGTVVGSSMVGGIAAAERDSDPIGGFYNLSISGKDLDEFDSFTVTVESATLFPTGRGKGKGKKAGGPITVDGLSGEVDLMNEADALTATVNLGEYSHLQLDVSEVSAEKDGESIDVSMPGNSSLQFNTSFDIVENETTHFQAVVRPQARGKSGYVLRPVPEDITVE